MSVTGTKGGISSYLRRLFGLQLHRNTGITLEVSLSEKKTSIASLSPCHSRIFPCVCVGVCRGRELAFTRCGIIGHREHPFQTQGERHHPSADLFRIFMTGWCLSGCSLAGLMQGSPRRDKTLMRHRVSWLEGMMETKRQQWRVAFWCSCDKMRQRWRLRCC